ncbi:cyclic peptide export ABC transporter [Endothiovibrio diazotrophicus]
MTDFKGGFFGLFLRESPHETALIIVLSLLAALFQASALVLVTDGAEGARTGVEHPHHLYYALASILAFSLCKQVALRRAVAMAESTASDIAMRIALRLRDAELQDIERIGADRIHARLTRDTATLSSAAWIAVLSLQIIALLAACLLYVLSVSPIGFCAMAGIVTLSIWAYRPGHRRQEAVAAAASAAEERFFGITRHILEGFNELKVAPAKARELYHRFFLPASEEALERRRELGRHSAWGMVLLDLCIYAILGTVALGLTQMDVITGVVLLLSVTYYLWEHIIGLFSYIPYLMRSRAALRRLDELEQELAELPAAGAGAEAEFEAFELREVRFHYPRRGDSHFSVGPIDLTVRRGETLFVVGANGSGKSTLLKLLTGLYRADEGELLLNGAPVEAADLRPLYSAVFTDYHLFDRLYGVERIDHGLAEGLLQDLQLSGKTRLEGDRFSTTRLSTGQRKRLALIAACLEQRPVLIFDEWTADQDPGFRRYFYHQLLPQLKAEGRTVIAVTHDDRYFHRADRVIHMELGRITDLPQGGVCA